MTRAVVAAEIAPSRSLTAIQAPRNPEVQATIDSTEPPSAPSAPSSKARPFGYSSTDTFELTGAGRPRAAPAAEVEEPRPSSLAFALPEVTGHWTDATRKIFESHYVQECMATFLALCGSEGQVLWALLKGHMRMRKSGPGITAFLAWLWEFFSRSPEETLKTLVSLDIPAAEREVISKIVIGRGARMVGTGVGVAQAVLAWNELARTMDNKSSGRFERIMRFVVFGGALLGCLPKLPQLRWVSSGVALAGAILDAALWSRRRAAQAGTAGIHAQTTGAQPTRRP